MLNFHVIVLFPSHTPFSANLFSLKYFFRTSDPGEQRHLGLLVIQCFYTSLVAPAHT